MTDAVLCHEREKRERKKGVCRISMLVMFALLVTSTNFFTVLPSAVAEATRLSVPLWSTCAGLSFFKLKLGVNPVAHTTAVTPDMAAAMESGSSTSSWTSSAPPAANPRLCARRTKRVSSTVGRGGVSADRDVSRRSRTACTPYLYFRGERREDNIHYVFEVLFGRSLSLCDYLTHLCLLHVAGTGTDGDALGQKLSNNAATGVTRGTDDEDGTVLRGGERGSLSRVAEREEIPHRHEGGRVKNHIATAKRRAVVVVAPLHVDVDATGAPNGRGGGTTGVEGVAAACTPRDVGLPDGEADGGVAAKGCHRGRRE